MDNSIRDPEPMDDPFALLLDDYASIVLEAAFTVYRDDEIMELNPDSEEERRARRLHNRLRKTHSLGAGSTLTVTDDSEAQTILNALSYYDVAPDTKYRQQCIEEVTSILFQHSVATLAQVPIITDVRV